MNKNKILNKIKTDIIELWELSGHYDKESQKNIINVMEELRNISNKIKVNEEKDINIIKSIKKEINFIFKRTEKIKNNLKLEIFQNNTAKK